jgi:hypothetical protein
LNIGREDGFQSQKPNEGPYLMGIPTNFISYHYSSCFITSNKLPGVVVLVN